MYFLQFKMKRMPKIDCLTQKNKQTNQISLTLNNVSPNARCFVVIMKILVDVELWLCVQYLTDESRCIVVLNEVCLLVKTCCCYNIMTLNRRLNKIVCP